MTSRLEIDALVCGHAERALFAPLTATLAAGDIVRVAGDNGAGKTTLLRTLAGLLTPLSGTFRWSTDGRASRAGLGFIDHDNALSPVLTPVENLSAVLRLHRNTSGVDEFQIVHTLAALGLKRVAHKPCRALSAGQKRRTALARLWLASCRVWLLDEPAAALDQASRERLARQMQIMADDGAAILYSTHQALNMTDTQVIELSR